MESGAPAAVVGTRLCLGYGAQVALEASDFVLPSGSITALIGPNGSGKTTLLNAIAGVMSPMGGTLTRAPATVATVFQATHEVEALPLTARATVTMGRYGQRGWFGRLRQDDRSLVERVMQRLDVVHLAERQLSDLSSGERQRVLVAQGIAQDAELLLLDEPITGLDLVSRGCILDVIREERAAGRTVVVSTHDLRDASDVDQVLLLSGRVVAAGPPSEVLTEKWLAEAYGSRLVRLGAESIFLDDTHHHGH